MPDCIRNRTCRTRDPDFAHAFDAERVHVRVVFLDQDRFDRGHIGVHRDVVFGQDWRSSVGRTANP